jgi:hypothetical protein
MQIYILFVKHFIRKTKGEQLFLWKQFSLSLDHKRQIISRSFKTLIDHQLSPILVNFNRFYLYTVDILPSLDVLIYLSVVVNNFSMARLRCIYSEEF